MQVTGCKDISGDGRLPPKPHPVGSGGHLLLMILHMRKGLLDITQTCFDKTPQRLLNREVEILAQKLFIPKVINNCSLQSFSKYAKIVQRVTINIYCLLLKENCIDFTRQIQFTSCIMSLVEV